MPAISIAETLGFAPFTPNETAGMVFGAAILVAAANAPKFDSLVAKIQRRNLGLCLDCGGAGRHPCKACRGRGVEGGGPLGFLKSEFVDDPFGPIKSPTAIAKSCAACGGRGQRECLACGGKAQG